MSNYTSISQNLNFTDFTSLLNQANINTGLQHGFWTGIYWMVVAIVFVSSVNFGWEIAFLMSFFSGLVIGIFLVYLGLMSTTVFGMTEAILIFMIIYLMYSSRSNQ